MRQPVVFVSIVAAIATAAVVGARTPHADHGELQQAVAAPSRSAANIARDRYRHPMDTLAFFGVSPRATVVEIWPGGGWYTEILAPLTKGRGTLYAAEDWAEGAKGIRALQAKDPALYGPVKLAAFPWTVGLPKVPDGSADVVLTFRNVHNWIMGEGRGGKDYSAEAFRQMFAMLKHGGKLGIEDHRLPESADAAREKTSGYVKVSTVRRLAEAAGFHFVGSSEINANPKDTADWPQGVWTLPPSYMLKAVDHDKYAAIGESDRMTLKFRKP